MYAPSARWRSRFFPVSPEETSKTLKVCLLKGLVSSVFCIFSSTKDAVVVAIPGGKAEVLPVIKGMLVPGTAVLFCLLYAIGSSRYRPETIFKAVMAFFLVMLAGYAFVLLPHIDFFTPKDSARRLLNYLGPQHTHWVAVYRNWPHTLYYLLAELWSQAVIFVAFWELANRLYTVKQAKRSYNLFITGGTLGNLFTIPLLTLLIGSSLELLQKMQILAGYIGVILILSSWLYHHISRGFPTSTRRETALRQDRLSFGEGVRVLRHSNYLVAIAITVLAVGMSINLVEVTWKANLKLYLGNDSAAMMLFMTKVNLILNSCTLFTVFFLSGNLLRWLGWRRTALLPPVIVGVTGVVFFATSACKATLAPLAHTLHLAPLQFVVYLGAFQVIASKLGKYAFYDITKEMSYIPLPQSTKAKAKAAIDAVGSRLGKSGSSAIHLSMLWLLGTSSVLDITFYLIPLLILITASWYFATHHIARHLAVHTH